MLSNGPINVEQSKLSALDIEVVDIDIKNASLPNEYHLVVAEDSQFDTILLSKIAVALEPRGFLLLIENNSAAPSSNLKTLNLQIVAIAQNNNYKYFLLKKVTRFNDKYSEFKLF